MRAAWSKLSLGRRLLAVYALAVLLRSLLLVLTAQRGYLDYNADGFTRTVHAWQWQQQPSFEVGVWLPLHFWLVGGVIHFWDNLYLAPRLVNLLCSFGTLANLLLLGRALFGERVGYLTALLAAVFPWEVWFGLSGMSESISHLLLSGAALLVVAWASSNRLRSALGAAVLIALATMVRYEAWFYALAFAVTLPAFYFAEQYRKRRLASGVVAGPAARLQTLKLLLVALLPFSFIALWLGASALTLGDPLAFAKATSQINSDWSPAAAQSDWWTKLTFYPALFLALAPPISGLLLVGVAVAAGIERSRRLFAYVALLLGEAVFFILITARYNNIGAGSDRYLVSLLLLLLPFVAYLLDLPLRSSWLRAHGGWLRPVLLMVSGLVFASVFVYSFDRTLARRESFPDRDTQAVAGYLRARFAAGSLPPDSRVVVNLPPASSDRHNAQYVFQVISNKPDNFIFLTDNATFNAVAGSAHPRLWLVDETAGNSNPPTGASELRFGRYHIALSGPQATLGAVVEQQSGQPGRVKLHGSGYPPGATIGLWVTSPSQQVTQLGTVQADASGQVALVFAPHPAQAAEGGYWAASGQVQGGGLIGIAWFHLTRLPSSTMKEERTPFARSSLLLLLLCWATEPAR